MKKAIIILLVSLVLFFPPVSVYFAIKSAEQLQFVEFRANLEASIFADIQQISRSSDESNYLIREHTRLCQILRNDKAEYLKNLNNHQLDNFIATIVTESINRAGFACEFEFLAFDENNTFVRSFHFGKDLGLQTLTAHLKNQDNVPLNLKPWQILYRNTLSEILSNNITKIAIREPGTCLTLSGEKISEKFFLLALGDMSNFSNQRGLQMKIRRFPARNYGLGVVFPESSAAVFSDFFKKQPELKALITTFAGRIGPQQLKIQAAGHELYFSEYDPLKMCRFFAVAPGNAFKSRRSPANHIWLVVIGLVTCVLFKVLTEKLALGRGPDISFKVMIPAVFIFLVIQPIFASTYLAGEFFRVSYANEKNRVAGKLSRDLVSIDMTTSDSAVVTINRARGFNSIERIASFTGVPYNGDDKAMIIKLMTMLREKFTGNIFSSIWFCRDENNFIGAKRQPAGEFKLERVDNMVADLFKKRFLEIMSLSRNGFQQIPTITESKLDKELKDELARDFFLKIFGSYAFYRFRQNSGIRLDIIANYRREQVLTNAISYRNQPYAYTAWYAERDNVNLLLPMGSLSIASVSPRIAIFGDEHSISSAKFGIKEISDHHPELTRIAESSHVTRTRAASIIETPETTRINMALPALHSNFTMAGSEIMRSFAVFRDYMEKRISLLVALIFVVGTLMAFAGAIYFVWPLRELTAATREVFMGNFSIRIHEDHPDEFAALGRSFNNMANGLEEGVLLKSFVTDSVRREVAEADDSSLAEKAELMPSTILFAAICGFDEYQKSHGAQEVFGLLQNLLQAADEATQRFGGEIDKMIEDKVMIVFEHRGENAYSCPERAIRTAAHICESVMKTTAMVVAAGVNRGNTIAGIMGAEKARLSRTVVGDPVNLAARLAYEAIKIQGGIVISGQMLDALPEGYSAEKLPISTVKGKTQAIEAYKITSQEKFNV